MQSKVKGETMNELMFSNYAILKAMALRETTNVQQLKLLLNYAHPEVDRATGVQESHQDNPDE
jgi:hypothetical protein